MSLPIVAIVGRPNVGKSSLLNSLVGRRISIVDATPGVTRDRVSAPCPLGTTNNADPASARYVELVDTGGMGIEDADKLTDHVESQIAYAMQAAALVVFVVDAREGASPLDVRVAQKLRRQDKPVVLVANKVDLVNLVSEVGELHKLGFGEALEVSAIHNLGRPELLERIEELLPDGEFAKPAEAVMKLAVVGKRNAGKSTFINALAGEDRVIVSQTPGTTRDSVDVTIELDGRPFTVIDTAGLRKRRRLVDVDFYSQHRALRSVRRADVVAMMIDASVSVSKVDKLLAGQIAENFKPVVLVVNKWDLACGKVAGEDYAAYFDKTFPELSYAPISLTTATEGMNVADTIRLAERLFDQARTRIPTAQLNEVIQKITELRGPSHKVGTRRPNILYASQIDISPPTIVCFVNDIRSFNAGYQRFLVNRLREHLPLDEVPIRLVFRQRTRKAIR